MTSTVLGGEVLHETKARQDGWGAAALYAFAAVAVGEAVQRRDGLFEPKAMIWLALAFIAAIAALFLSKRSSPTLADAAVGRPSPSLLLAVLAFGLAFEFYRFFTHDLPGSWHATSDNGVVNNAFLRSLLAVGAAGVAAMFAFPRRARVLFPLLITIYLVMGVWIIRRVPVPFMDVWVAQTEGLKALLGGNNPFTAAFPDLYHKPDLYAKGALYDGLVHLGFPYPPMVVWLELPGQILGGDYRYSNLVSVALAAALIAYARPRREGEGRWEAAVGPLAAALFLFTPRALFVLESGWTEPSTILLLAGCVFCAVRRPAGGGEGGPLVAGGNARVILGEQAIPSICYPARAVAGRRARPGPQSSRAVGQIVAHTPHGRHRRVHG